MDTTGIDAPRVSSWTCGSVPRYGCDTTGRRIMRPSDTAVLDPHGLRVRVVTPGELVADNYDGAPPSCAPTITIPTTRTQGHPRQLSSLDLQLLDAESPTTPLHIGSVTVLDSGHAPGGPLDIVSLRRVFAQRLHLVAPLRRRLRTVPLGLDLPYWEDCTAVDLGYHVRDARLPADGGDEDLAEFVSRLHATPLDRARPLWECHLLSGLPGGRQAIYTKVHHAVIDGVSAAEIMAAVLDIVADFAPPPVPDEGVLLDRTPSTIEMLARSVPNVITRQAARAQAALQAGPALLRSVGDIRKKHSGVPFNGPNTGTRSFAFVSLPLDAVKEIKASIDGTVNDVVMALCTAALRRWLLDHGGAADRPLLAAVPASVRTPEQFGTAGNHFSIMLCELPITEPDPHHRLKLLHNGLLEVKQRFQAQPPTVLHQATSLLPPLLHGLATRTLLRAAAPALPLANVIISNVPGPQIPLYANGIRVQASYPISVLTELSGSLNITVLSYDGHLDFGILACPDAVPDVWDIARYLEEALVELQD
jgi:WS/DGAT/MGAT family acyltransferase